MPQGEIQRLKDELEQVKKESSAELQKCDEQMVYMSLDSLLFSSL